MEPSTQNCEAVIETPRLRILPLTAAQMRLFANDWPALLRTLGVPPSLEWSDAGARAAALRHADATDRDPGNWRGGHSGRWSSRARQRRLAELPPVVPRPRFAKGSQARYKREPQRPPPR